jgi:hypothetical protein
LDFGLPEQCKMISLRSGPGGFDVLIIDEIYKNALIQNPKSKITI